MGDLIRNYKKILAGKNRDSDSDSESQPLMSSGSVSSSFGATNNDSLINKFSDSSTELEDSNMQPCCIYPSKPLPFAANKRLERQMFPPNFEPPELDVYTNQENIYECHKHYAKIVRLLGDKDSNSVNLENKDIVKSSSTESYEIFPNSTINQEKSTHNSLVTIFAIWNTTMGSSLLAMAWGMDKAGLFAGLGVNIAIAGICLYTAYILLCINEKHGVAGHDMQVSDLCRMLIGRWAEILAKIFSIVVLSGANIVYWILMSNFLYNSVYFVHATLTSIDEEPINTNSSVLCPNEIIVSLNSSNKFVYNMQNLASVSTFDKVWNLYRSVPIIMAIVMFPVVNFKSPTFFAKFNCLGTVSVAYLLIFVAIKSAKWGIHIPDWTTEFHIKPTFGALSGMLSLAYFIHSIILNIMRNNRHQEHNGRDLSIAFGLITFTYLFIGILFYMCFPLAKSCIQDNLLNNFSTKDLMTIVARVLLLFQLFTVFPLLTYNLRNDILININIFFKNERLGDITYWRVVIINTIIIIICVLFSCFLPKIGTLIRFTGAISGMVYIFLLPSLLKVASLKKEKRLTTLKFILYILLIITGGVNVLSQFFIYNL